MIDSKIIGAWGLGEMGSPLIIAGPCSAESEGQVMATASALEAQRVDILRFGIWKPRTRPNSFEGVGSVGLRWVREAGLATNLPVAVEVATPEHVEECLRADIDVLWVGARTTVNPFAVQSIADALRGVDIPVMVKNPVNPDLEVWIGALERLNKAGLTQLAAIHRGFSTIDKAIYRNKPKWQIPIELRRLAPDLPLICDPSHICGNTELLQEVSQRAMDLGFDGLMIEVHISPRDALSDAKQQLTPLEFGELLSRISPRERSTDGFDDHAGLEQLRGVIDTVDAQLLDLLSKRMEICRDIGRLKNRNRSPLYQPGRWDEIVNSRTRIGIAKGLSEDFIFELFQCIHQESISVQTLVEKPNQ